MPKLMIWRYQLSNRLWCVRRMYFNMTLEAGFNKLPTKQIYPIYIIAVVRRICNARIIQRYAVNLQFISVYSTVIKATFVGNSTLIKDQKTPHYHLQQKNMFHALPIGLLIIIIISSTATFRFHVTSTSFCSFDSLVWWCMEC